MSSKYLISMANPGGGRRVTVWWKTLRNEKQRFGVLRFRLRSHGVGGLGSRKMVREGKEIFVESRGCGKGQ